MTTREVLDVERAVSYLREMGNLWRESPRQIQREFVREVFDRIVVEGRQVELSRQRLYARRFSCWIGGKDSGEISVVWLPKQVKR